MLILFILGLILGGAAVIFALQNVMVVTVSFFNWQFEGSLSLVLLLAIASGILVALLMIFPEILKNHLKIMGLKRDTKKLEEELRKQKELTVFAKDTTPTREDIAHIERATIVEPAIAVAPTGTPASTEFHI